MKKFLVIISFLFLIFSAEKTYACSCVPPETAEQSFQTSRAIFSAKVLSITENKSKYIKVIKLKLKESWKGNLLKTFTITTAFSGGMCGYTFKVGREYLIYANGKDSKSLSTTNCTRTAILTSNKDVEILDKLRKNN